jgi:hypothetical protein
VERLGGTSGATEDEKSGRAAPGESRVELRHKGEREWRCRHALVVAGEGLVPEALQGAEIVAVSGPLELGPMFASHQLDRVGVGVNKLAEQVEEADVAGNCARLRREEPQRHAVRSSAPVRPRRKYPNPTHPAVCDGLSRFPDP